MLSKILPLYRLSSGCDYHRVLLPLGFAGYDFNLIKDMTTEKLRGFKVIYFNRTPLNVPAETIKKLKSEYGMKVVMDLDDYWELYPKHYLHKKWEESKTPERIKQYMAVSDEVVCTTERLATKIREFNPNVHVFPNAMPLGTTDQYAFNRTESTKTRFGFVGGTSHTEDMRTIFPVFQHYNHLDFTFYGFIPKNPEALRIAAYCSNNFKNPYYKSMPQVPLDKYMYGYDNLDCCIAPLVDEEFNKYKSNLKVLEAGLKKCALICSPIACYTDTVPDDMVTYCKSIKDWKIAIKQHQDLAYTRERGEKLHKWVIENYSLEEINKPRMALLESLCKA